MKIIKFLCKILGTILALYSSLLYFICASIISMSTRCIQILAALFRFLRGRTKIKNFRSKK